MWPGTLAVSVVTSQPGESWPAEPLLLWESELAAGGHRSGFVASVTFGPVPKDG